jgi:spectinomycin phosphotransferase
MKHRIDIADNTVIAVVQGYFGIHLRSLEFLPVGEGSWAYKGIDASKRQWFIKLSRLNTSAIARITSYLHDEHNLTFVLSPIATKSKDAMPKINNNYLSIYPFLEGETLNYDSLNERYRIEIAGDLRLLILIFSEFTGWTIKPMSILLVITITNGCCKNILTTLSASLI